MNTANICPDDTPYGAVLFRKQVVAGAPVWVIQATSRQSSTLYMIEITYADLHITKLVRQSAHLHWPDRPNGTAWLCWSAQMQNGHFLMWDYEPIFDYTAKNSLPGFSTKELRTYLSNVISRLHPGWLELYQKGFTHHE